MKRGVKPKGKIELKWSSNFAYAIGLLATDGCLSNDGRHILLTSKDKEQLRNFAKALNTKLKIGINRNGHGQTAFRVQFGDVRLYSFLESIGLSKAKSLTIGELCIPKEYFFDFLRGCFDGDGSSYSYWDPRWKSSYMFYTEFCSASIKFIEWIRREIECCLKIKGHITSAKRKNTYYQLKYAKKESMILIRGMYKNKKSLFLKRKKLKIERTLGIVGLKI